MLSQHFQVITYDTLGHGDSQDPPEAATLQQYCMQLRQLMDHLAIARAHVVGHSMGALIALEFALTHPERCQRVVALNAVFCRTPAQMHAIAQRVESLQTSGIEASLDATIARWFENTTDPNMNAIAAQVREFLRSAHPLGYRRAYELFARSDRAHIDRLSHLSMPVLFMTGEFDSNSTPTMSQAMAQLAPRARVDVLTDARHMMTLTHADAINQRLVQFLAT
jgi:pimeloyl-ACP methyl ester carboxylesterase